MFALPWRGHRREGEPPRATCSQCGGAIGADELVWREIPGAAPRAGYPPAGDAARVWHIDCLQIEGHDARLAPLRRSRRDAVEPVPETVEADGHAQALRRSHRDGRRRAALAQACVSAERRALLDARR